MSEANQ